MTPRIGTDMRRSAIFALVAITLATTGCVSTPTPARSCSGRITTDNGHVVRNEEDCVWGEKYSPPRPQPVYVVQQATYAPQYVVAPPPVMIPPPVYMQPVPFFGAPFIYRGGGVPQYGGRRFRR
jgi:hypothetical protein